MKQLLMGVSKMDITPSWPMNLAGFGHRTDRTAEVAHRLFARVCFFEKNIDGSLDRFILISADLIWWGSKITADITSRLRHEWNLEQSRIILHATHTHGSPQTEMFFTPTLGIADVDYLDQLRQKILTAVAAASQNLESIRIERGYGIWDYGINRRKSVEGAFIMAPNPEGCVDKEIIVFRFIGEAGNTKALLAHYTCHPTTTDEARFTSEYCGVAMEHIERHYGPDMVAAFLQGTCGDIRPALIRDIAFYRGSGEEVAYHGEQFAGKILDVLRNPMEPLENMGISSYETFVALPFSNVPDPEYLRECLDYSDIRGQWSHLLLSRPEKMGANIPFRMTMVRLAKGLSFLAMNGEVVVEYGHYIKRRFNGNVLPLPYSNGMIGYVPTAAQTEEGGYEGRESHVYFGLPAPFAPAVEGRIRAAIGRLGRKIKPSI